MKTISPQYLRKLISISTLVLFVTIALFASVFKPYFTYIIPITQLFIIFTSLFFHSKMTGALSKSNIQFNTAFLSTTALKLLFNILFISLYIGFIKENVKVFVVYFLVMYFIYLIFDVKSILFEMKIKKSE